MSRSLQQFLPTHARAVILAGALAIALAGCGSDSMTALTPTSTARGTLLHDPPLRIASLTAATFAASLGASASGAQLLEIAGAPACGVDFYYISTTPWAARMRRRRPPAR